MSADISMMASTAPSAARHNARADYDLKLGLYRGITKSYERVRPIPPTPAPFDLSGMLQNANIASAEDAVIYLERRFLRLSCSTKTGRTSWSFFRAECLTDFV